MDKIEFTYGNYTESTKPMLFPSEIRPGALLIEFEKPVKIKSIIFDIQRNSAGRSYFSIQATNSFIDLVSTSALKQGKIFVSIPENKQIYSKIYRFYFKMPEGIDAGWAGDAVWVGDLELDAIY